MSAVDDHFVSWPALEQDCHSAAVTVQRRCVVLSCGTHWQSVSSNKRVVLGWIVCMAPLSAGPVRRESIVFLTLGNWLVPL